MGKLRDLHYELLEHPPYSPDLVPSDFCLFPKLKLFLASQRFSLNQDVIAAVILQILQRITTGTG
jgi:histone-lysine N-methyltransferase SETMAR